MASEPKKRHSRERQGQRRAAIKLAVASVTACKNCGAEIAPHTVCKKCGYYKGRQVVKV